MALLRFGANTVIDMAHPVSGNRRFGYAPADGGGYVFFTRGADRAAGVMDVAAMSIVFSTAHSLWLSLQKGIESFVTGNGGTATIGSATSIRTPWDAVRASHHRPSVGWI
jgi:hypothetical protein